MQIAGLSMHLRQFAVAQHALKTALKMDPQLTNAWLTLARIQAALQDPAAARKTLERAAEKLPEDSSVFLQLGGHYTREREPGLAVVALEKSLALAGDNVAVLEMLAHNYLLLGDFKRARNYADRLVNA